ncbi:MAG: dTDP-4-dehydrorhamnose reductase [Bacteroidales bacterium]|jgi:dTDP-4-dehydrorhamnose reductase|nr:dTDP-4-dehydrorhamnose reductase [Bacteroidales bacterium]
MMNIAVFGAYGQLGRSIRDICDKYPQTNFIFTDMDTVDISDYDAIENFVYKNRPNIFINCAAYTAVDKAEQEKELAMRLNAHAVDNLARIAKKNAIFMIHISTDYVFDGKGYKPYFEDDKTCPLSVYGLTKRVGEEVILSSGCRAAIIRTSWLYSEHGVNFVKTMLRLAEVRQQLNVVSDQTGTPTYAHDLAKTIMQIILQNEKVQQPEIYHYSNEGIASWYDFASEIMFLGKRTCNIIPISTQQYPTPAIRPYYSVLDKQKIKSHFKITIPCWRDSLEVCLTNIFNADK